MTAALREKLENYRRSLLVLRKHWFCNTGAPTLPNRDELFEATLIVESDLVREGVESAIEVWVRTRQWPEGLNKDEQVNIRHRLDAAVLILELFLVDPNAINSFVPAMPEPSYLPYASDEEAPFLRWLFIGVWQGFGAFYLTMWGRKQQRRV